jgi:hypothetical protein
MASHPHELNAAIKTVSRKMAALNANLQHVREARDVERQQCVERELRQLGLELKKLHAQRASI